MSRSYLSGYVDQIPVEDYVEMFEKAERCFQAESDLEEAEDRIEELEFEVEGLKKMLVRFNLKNTVGSKGWDLEDLLNEESEYVFGCMNVDFLREEMNISLDLIKEVITQEHNARLIEKKIEEINENGK